MPPIATATLVPGDRGMSAVTAAALFGNPISGLRDFTSAPMYYPAAYTMLYAANYTLPANLSDVAANALSSDLPDIADAVSRLPNTIQSGVSYTLKSGVSDARTSSLSNAIGYRVSNSGTADLSFTACAVPFSDTVWADAATAAVSGDAISAMSNHGGAAVSHAATAMSYAACAVHFAGAALYTAEYPGHTVPGGTAPGFTGARMSTFTAAITVPGDSLSGMWNLAPATMSTFTATALVSSDALSALPNRSA